MELLTDDIHALKEDVAEDVEVEVAAALDAAESEALVRWAIAKVGSVELVECVAHREGDVGDRCARGVLPAALLVVVCRTFDRI